MSSEERLVVIAEFSYPHQAEVARIELEQAGIDCSLLDGEMGGLVLTGVIPVRMQVREADAPRAREILVEKGLYKYDA